MRSTGHWEQVGENVRLMRQLMKLSQIDLAERAGVERSTIQRLEAGKSVRKQSFLRVCGGLGADHEEIWSMQRSFGPSDRRNAVFHDPAQATWYAYEDERARVPDDNEARIQDVAERCRLGELGFVTRFRSYLHFVMMQGPGVFIVEVHGLYRDGVETGSGGVYEDWIMYGLSGEVKVMTADGERRFGPGSAMGFRSGFDFSVDRWSPEGEPPRLIFIGANRRKK